MTDLASAAFRLALRGKAVFPLAPGSKVPSAGTHGLRDASKEADVARARWAKKRHANIGVATGVQSGFWVLDIDPRHGGDKSFKELTGSRGKLPATVSVLTPSDGVHMWWRWSSSGAEIRNSAGRVGPGIDVRGAGGYCIAPPSVLSNGKRYRWTKGANEIVPAPDWLVHLTLPPPPPPRPEAKPLNGKIDSYCAAAIADELRHLEQVGEGCRNDQLNRTAFAIAGFVLAGAVPEDWARSQLETRAIDRGLPAHEARRTIESAFKAAKPRELPR